MSDEIVPQNDLPDEVVPEHDLPDQPKSYDPRDLVPRSIGAGTGAITGAIGVPIVQSGVNKVNTAKTGLPNLSMPPEGVPPGHTPFNPRGRTVEQSIENWTNYNRAQLEEAKKIRQESKLHKKYPGFTRAGTVPEIPPLPKNATVSEQIAARVWPGAAQDIGHFVQGVSEYKLPFIGKVGPLAGHLVGGAAAGSQGVDAYNRYQQGDTTGSIISGVGALGTGVATLPTPPIIKGIGAGVGLSAEAINAYRDAVARGDIEHGAPENPEQTTPMGSTYATGGLVCLADGGGVAPYGFRHVENVNDVSLPKGSGWFGHLPNQNGQISTEISADNNGMQYPMINPNMNHQDINSLLANQKPTDEMYEKAEQWAKYRQSQGKSPFISPVGEMRWPLPKK
jgi:hypothetical protein